MKQQENKKLVSSGGVTANYRLQIRKISPFEKIEKEIEKIKTTLFNSEKNLDKKIEMLIGITQGARDQVLTVVGGIHILTHTLIVTDLFMFNII